MNSSIIENPNRTLKVRSGFDSRIQLVKSQTESNLINDFELERTIQTPTFLKDGFEFHTK